MDGGSYNDEGANLLSEERNKGSLPLTTKLIAIASFVVVLILIAVSLALAYQIGRFNNLHAKSSSFELVRLY